jgi:hypothetical protein
MFVPSLKNPCWLSQLAEVPQKSASNFFFLFSGVCHLLVQDFENPYVFFEFLATAEITLDLVFAFFFIADFFQFTCAFPFDCAK